MQILGSHVRKTATVTAGEDHTELNGLINERGKALRHQVALMCECNSYIIKKMSLYLLAMA